MAAEDPRFLLHFKTLAKFNEKLADGVVSSDRHLCFISDEALIWCRGKYYNDGTKLGDITSLYNDWEITQTSATSITITIKGKQWNESTREFEDISKSLNIQPATRSIAGLMSAADKTKLDGLNENNVSGVTIAATPVQVNVTVTKDNGLAADTSTTSTFPIASASSAGSMSSADKSKLDRITGTNHQLALTKRDTSTNVITLSGINPADGSPIKTEVTLSTATKTEAGLMSSDLLEEIDDKFSKMKNFASFNKSDKPTDAETTFVSAANDQDTLDMYTEGNISLHMHQTATSLGIKHDTVTQSLVTPATGEVINKVTSDDQGHLLTTTKTDLINRAKKLDHNVTINLTDADSKNGVTGTATADMSGTVINIATEISPIDASKITSGTIDIARLPQGALERLVIVADQAARYALTTNDVQNGDTVKQEDTGEMWYVKDQTKLNSSAGWEVYTAGRASEAPWTGITGKPTSIQITSGTDSPITSPEVALSAGKITLTTTISKATTSVSGLMSAADKTEFDRITTANFALGTVTQNGANVVIAASKTNVTNGSAVANNITIPAATTTAAGVMTATQVTTLNTVNTRPFFGIVSGDTGTATSDAVNDKLTIAGGTDIGTVATDTSANDVLTVNHSAITRTNAADTTATYTMPANGIAVALPKIVKSVTSSATGHITATASETPSIAHGTVTTGATVGTDPKPGFGGTFNAVTAITNDGHGHVTGVTTTPVTIPNSVATQTFHGLMAAGDKTKLDSIETGANKYVLPTASATVLGGIKSGYTQSGRNYPVQINADGHAFVGVPWTDTTYSLPLAAAGTRGGIKIGFPASGKMYPVKLSGQEQAYVEVPWSDTVYTHPAGSAPSKGVGFYKFSTDANSHVASVTAVTKADITGLGIPGADTNTTYSFANGTDGSFTVTPVGGSAQKVTIGKPATAGTADSANSVAWGNVTGKTDATTSASGLMSSTDKSKLDGIAAGAQKNQNAFGFVTVGSTTLAADNATGTLALVAGTNVTLTPNATNDSVTIAATDTKYTLPVATTSSLGGIRIASSTVQSTAANSVTSQSGKTYAVQLNANNQAVVNVPWTDTTYSLPTASSTVLGGVKVGSGLSISNGVLSANAGTDTKNTAGATNSATGKLYIVGASTQDVNPVTYTRNHTYITSDGLVSPTYSGNSVIITYIQSGAEDGVIQVQSDMRAVKSITCEDKISAVGGFFETSDGRFKDNVIDMDASKAKDIRLVEFDRNDMDHHGYGVIAQELEKVYPSMVHTEDDGFKSVNYNEVALVKIKYLEDKVARLEALVEKLINQ